MSERAAPASAPHYGAWLQQIAAAPYRFDFYQTLRHIESAHPHLPRLGEAVRPSDEPIRVAQPADLSFAPASVQGLSFPADGPPRLSQRIFGLLGPNGPLPLHITEVVRERSQHNADPVLQRFMDTLTHRFALLFYRAWAQAQPALSLDRPGDTAFIRRLGSLAGMGQESLLGRDAIGDKAKLHFTGRLARHVRDADGLLAWCKSEFNAPVRIEEWCGHWMPLARDERTRLRSLSRSGGVADAGQCLGRGAVLGATAWEVQHKFRIVIGPLREARYHAFLPGGRDLARLQAIVRQWVGLEFEWDLKLILARPDVPRLQLGRSGELGRSCWLGRYSRASDADDLVINVERTLKGRRGRRPPDAAPPP
jgi:type VI secretion system protein ImpH